MTARKPRTGAPARTFASVAEVVEYALGPSELDDANRASQRVDDAEFSGTDTFGDACRLAFGWADGADRVERTRVAIAAHGLKPRNESIMREVGPGVVSMGAFLSGHPQPYVVIRPGHDIRPGGKIVRIAVNVAASAYVARSIIETRGAAVCAVVDALERAGRRVQITAISASKTARATVPATYTTTVKAADDRLNLPTVAFALAHASFLRRLMFAVREREDKATRDLYHTGEGRGYGSPADVTDHGADIYLGCMTMGDPNFATPEAAAAWVRTTLASQGVTVIDGKGE